MKITCAVAEKIFIKTFIDIGSIIDYLIFQKLRNSRFSSECQIEYIDSNKRDLGENTYSCHSSKIIEHAKPGCMQQSCIGLYFLHILCANRNKKKHKANVCKCGRIGRQMKPNIYILLYQINKAYLMKQNTAIRSRVWQIVATPGAPSMTYSLLLYLIKQIQRHAYEKVVFEDIGNRSWIRNISIRKTLEDVIRELIRTRCINNFRQYFKNSPQKCRSTKQWSHAGFIKQILDLLITSICILKTPNLCRFVFKHDESEHLDIRLYYF